MTGEEEHFVSQDLQVAGVRQHEVNHVTQARAAVCSPFDGLGFECADQVERVSRSASLHHTPPADRVGCDNLDENPTALVDPIRLSDDVDPAEDDRATPPPESLIDQPGVATLLTEDVTDSRQIDSIRRMTQSDRELLSKHVAQGHVLIRGDVAQQRRNGVLAASPRANETDDLDIGLRALDPRSRQPIGEVHDIPASVRLDRLDDEGGLATSEPEVDLLAHSPSDQAPRQGGLVAHGDQTLVEVLVVIVFS